MKRIATLTVAAALMAMSGTAAFAQSHEAHGKAAAAQQEKMEHKGNSADWQSRRADMQRVMEARIAGIPAGLKLTADQQKLWQPVESAIKANMKARSDFMDKMHESRKDAKDQPDFITRLDHRSQMAQMAAQNSKSLLDAMKPFWASLDDGQKKLLPALMHPPGNMMRGMRGKGRMGGMMEHHGGMMGGMGHGGGKH